MELNSKKKSGWNRTMRSSSIETHDVKQIGQKKDESRDFSNRIMGIINEDFQMEGKGCKHHVRLKMSTRRSMAERGRCLATLPGR